MAAGTQRDRMDGPLISFIIPVYNTEAWLAECVDSILGQLDAPGLAEIILVDDGSTDGSPGICDRYRLASADVITIHQENQGLSGARNSGLGLARGKYVSFVDSDDKLADGALRAAISYAAGPDADLVFLGTANWFADGSISDYGLNLGEEPLRGKTRSQAMAYLASRPKNPITAWGKLIRRGLLEAHGYRFDPSHRSGEDVDFSLGLFMFCDSFDFIPGDFYLYRRARSGSITSSVDLTKVNTFVSIMDRWAGLAKTEFADCGGSILSMLAYNYAVILGVAGTGQGLAPAETKALRKELKERAYLLHYAANRKTKLVSLLAKAFGLRLASQLLGLYLRRRAW